MPEPLWLETTHIRLWYDPSPEARRMRLLLDGLETSVNLHAEVDRDETDDLVATLSHGYRRLIFRCRKAGSIGVLGLDSEGVEHAREVGGHRNILAIPGRRAIEVARGALSWLIGAGDKLGDSIDG